MQGVLNVFLGIDGVVIWKGIKSRYHGGSLSKDGSLDCPCHTAVHSLSTRQPKHAAFSVVWTNLPLATMVLSNLRSRLGGKATLSADTPGANTSESDVSVLRDGGLAYVRAKGGNDSGPSYQEAVGAPVESNSPLGYNVGWLTVIFLNVNQMIGTGIFSTRTYGLLSQNHPCPPAFRRVYQLVIMANWAPAATILSNTGSVGLALIYWVIGFIMAIAGFSTYLEFASYFPNRSGAEVVYLEQAYPRPKHLFPIAFAVQSVLLSFSASNAIGMPRADNVTSFCPECPAN